MKKKVFYLGMLLFMTLVFTGCPDPGPNPNLNPGPGKETTYTFKCNANLSGVKVEAIIYEYNGSEIVGQKSFNCVKGLKEVVTVNPKATKVKVKTILGSELVLWVMKVYYLEDGKNINIELNDDTKMIPTEPI